MYEIDPAERLVLVLMIQLLPYTERTVRESFETAVYQAIVAQATPTARKEGLHGPGRPAGMTAPFYMSRPLLQRGG